MTKRKSPVVTPVAAAWEVSQPVGLAASIAPSVGVRFSSLDSKTRADKGVECHIVDDYGNKIGLSIVVHGNDSDRFRRAAVQRRREINDVVEKLVGERDSAENREIVTLATIAADIRLMARCTSAFIGLVDDDGEPIACTEANAVELYTNAGDVREQVDMFLGNRRNFMPA